MMQDWFKEAKLGIFIHYGIYCDGNWSESWSFHNGDVSYERYMQQCENFTASKYDPKKWAELFKKAGANYVVLTSKHHDGVALFDTKYSDLSVVKKTPAGRDLIAPYVEAVREAGMHVGLYYSLLDWSDPRYRSIYPEGQSPENYNPNDIYGCPVGGPEAPEKWEEFLEFNNNQMREILTNYGTVDLIWFDGDWERSAKQWKAPELREYLHRLNPNIIINSRLQGYGDYDTPEQGAPIVAPTRPWEFCTTINNNWGYRKYDNDYKTSRMIIRMFGDCLTMGGNMLLDVGPKADGSLDPRQEQILLDLGSWIDDNREAVYGTDKGINYRYFLGGSTVSKDRKTLYLISYDRPDEYFCLKGLLTPVKRISVLHSNETLQYRYTGMGPNNGTLWINIAKDQMHRFATVIKVELEDELRLSHSEGEVITNND